MSNTTTEPNEPKKEPKQRFRSTFYFNGKRYETTGKSQREADKKAALRKRELEHGEIGVSGDMTVLRWASEWLETYKRPNVGDNHYNRCESYIKNVVVPAIGSQKLKSVTNIELQQIMNSRAGYSESDVKKLRILIKELFLKAYKARLIVYNPAEDLILPRVKEQEQRRSLTDHERNMILELAETHRAGLWVKTMLYCGLRPGETRALDWQHIDFEKKEINVRLAMKASTTEIDKPKSAAGVRDVPIPEKLLLPLQEVVRGQSEAVFTQPTTGKRHTEKSMNCMWDNFKRQLDINMGAVLYRNKIVESKVAEDLVPYCLRHTFCTDLQDAGVPINVAKNLMGHSDISVTAKVYTHTTDRALKDAAEKMNKFADGGKNGGMHGDNAVK